MILPEYYTEIFFYKRGGVGLHDTTLGVIVFPFFCVLSKVHNYHELLAIVCYLPGGSICRWVSRVGFNRKE